MGRLTLMIVLLAYMPARAAVCPVAFLECLPSADERIGDAERLERAGAADWEIQAWRAIRSGNIGKGPLDVIDWSTRGRPGWWDFGHYHLAFGPGSEDVLGVGIRMDTPGWSDWATAVLYVDRSRFDYRIQLDRWRRRVQPAIRAARQAGCRLECRAAVAAIANSSPTLARRLGEETGFDFVKMLHRYATTPHRSRRARWFLENIL